MMLRTKKACNNKPSKRDLNLKILFSNLLLIDFSASIWDALIWAHRWPYESIDGLVWAHPCALRAYRIQEDVRERMLEYFLQLCHKDCTKRSLQRVDLLHIKLKLRGLNYQTPFYADCILKYLENCHKTTF
jgi:hypothetical protein